MSMTWFMPIETAIGPAELPCGHRASYLPWINMADYCDVIFECDVCGATVHDGELPKYCCVCSKDTSRDYFYIKPRMFCVGCVSKAIEWAARQL